MIWMLNGLNRDAIGFTGQEPWRVVRTGAIPAEAVEVVVTYDRKRHNLGQPHS